MKKAAIISLAVGVLVLVVIAIVLREIVFG